MGKHPIAQIFLQPHGGAKKANAPQKAAQDHENDDHHHFYADLIQQKVHVKGNCAPIHHHGAVGHAVDNHAVELWNLQLQDIHQHQRHQAQQQPQAIADIIAVDMFSKYHYFHLPWSKEI